MDNEALKQVFMNLHERIIKEVNPNSIIDELYCRDVVGNDDMRTLREIPDPKIRCRKLLYTLRSSAHPETFIHLREALFYEHRDIVEQRRSATKCVPLCL